MNAPRSSSALPPGSTIGKGPSGRILWRSSWACPTTSPRPLCSCWAAWSHLSPFSFHENSAGHHRGVAERRPFPADVSLEMAFKMPPAFLPRLLKMRSDTGKLYRLMEKGMEFQPGIFESNDVKVYREKRPKPEAPFLIFEAFKILST